MKILFFITLLANIIFFFWEYNLAGSQSSLVERSRLKELNTIVLLSELTDDKQQAIDSKILPIVVTKPDKETVKLTQPYERQVIPTPQKSLVQEKSTEIPQINQLVKADLELMVGEIKKQKVDEQDTNRSLSENYKDTMNEYVLSLPVSEQIDSKEISKKNEILNEKIIVDSVLENKLGSNLAVETSDTVLNDFSITSKSSEAENEKKKLLKRDDKNQQQNDTKIEVKDNPIKAEEDSVSSKQANVKTINSQKDKVDVRSELLGGKNKLKVDDNRLLDRKQSTTKQKKNETEFCYQVGPFTDTVSLNDWGKLNKIQANSLQQFNKEIKTITSYLVYYPAAETYAKSKQQVSLFKEKGITDYWLFRTGELKGITSLGLFVRKDRAIVLQEKLLKIGIAAKVMSRYKTENSLFAEVLTKDKAFRDKVQFSNQQVFSEC